ncbi:unnamed protein product [Protopolystoma xenopodis]|uniref:Uncharacterized protein n=1 Tax=Protopolystoma xenopodis TaxID=117903 RepID=A0A448WB90_9PLAT|nr:unnamed protein product [Protopolystoma xenopodis]
MQLDRQLDQLKGEICPQPSTTNFGLSRQHHVSFFGSSVPVGMKMSKTDLDCLYCYCVRFSGRMGNLIGLFCIVSRTDRFPARLVIHASSASRMLTDKKGFAANAVRRGGMKERQQKRSSGRVVEDLLLRHILSPKHFCLQLCETEAVAGTGPQKMGRHVREPRRGCGQLAVDGLLFITNRSNVRNRMLLGKYKRWQLE